MDDERKELILYRLQRAFEDLEVSRLSFENKYLNAALNRCYYAIFHAARALLALDGVDFKKHSGVISYFNKNYVKTGKFKAEMAKILLKITSVA